MWVLVTAAIFAMLLLDVRSTRQYQGIRYLLHAGYVVALLWHLSLSGPPTVRLPELAPQLLPRWRFGAWVPVLAIGVLLGLTAFFDAGTSVLLNGLIVATVWILLVWRREVRLRVVAQGIAVGLVAYLAALPMARNGFIGDTVLYLLPLLSAPMYVAGGLVFDRTRLGGVQLIAGRYREALTSFLCGCLLFVPLGMLNAAGGSPGAGITWVTEWWMPVTLPWFSGIAEETWFRLFLLGLCFFLLRPAFRTRPALAVVGAVLFSGITFGLGHGRTLERFLTTGLLYGVPMAAVFARRDWEHAVGAHYMVNMIPWLSVFSETR
jgi:hypothetical protein